MQRNADDADELICICPIQTSCGCMTTKRVGRTWEQQTSDHLTTTVVMLTPDHKPSSSSPPWKRILLHTMVIHNNLLKTSGGKSHPSYMQGCIYPELAFYMKDSQKVARN